MYRVNKNHKDVEYILNHLRYEDEQECKALFGDNWKEKTLNHIMTSKFYVMLGNAKSDKTPVCMGGFEHTAQDDPGIGCAWFLCTDDIKKHKICILRELKEEIKKADERFWLTYNIIYEKNFSAKSWLKRLGYKFDNPKPKGADIPEGFEFFYRIRPIKGLGE